MRTQITQDPNIKFGTDHTRIYRHPTSAVPPRYNLQVHPKG